MPRAVLSDLNRPVGTRVAVDESYGIWTGAHAVITGVEQGYYTVDMESAGCIVGGLYFAPEQLTSRECEGVLTAREAQNARVTATV